MLEDAEIKLNYYRVQIIFRLHHLIGLGTSLAVYSEASCLLYCARRCVSEHAEHVTLRLTPGWWVDALPGMTWGKLFTHVPLFTKQYKLVPTSPPARLWQLYAEVWPSSHIQSMDRFTCIGWQVTLCDPIRQAKHLRHSLLSQGLRNGDEHHSHWSQSCERTLLTINNLTFNI